jgi:hypothetical protein
MANLHLTFIQKVFGSTVPSFGCPGASTGVVPEILV